MADVVGLRSNADVSWIEDSSNQDQALVFVSDVNTAVNMHMGMKKDSRCSSKTKGNWKVGHRVKGEAKAIVTSEGGARKKLYVYPIHQPKVSLLNMDRYSIPTTTTIGAPVDQTALHTIEQAVPEVAQVRSHVSLKDLCAEDKHRIANLIQELARVNEEKDETAQRLQEEQQSFEKKIQQLEEQNQLIIQERENLKQQYHECQELLGLYQQYLTQQQEKLNESITQLQHSCSKQKVRGNEDGSSRPWGSKVQMQDLSGSCQSLSPYRGTCPSLPSEQPLASVPIQLSSGRERTEPTKGQFEKNGGGRSKSQPGSSAKEGCFVSRVPSCHGALEPCSFHHSVCMKNGEDNMAKGLKNGGYSSLLSEDGKHFDRTPVPCSAREGLGRRKVVTTAPALTLEDWEKRKHQLMLQKMELEVQRERLQTHVIQQEERLLQKQLECSRFQDVEVPELERSSTGVKFSKQEARSTGQSVNGQVNIVPGEVVNSIGQAATEKLQNKSAAVASYTSDNLVLLRGSSDGVTLSSQHAAPSPMGSQVEHRPAVVPVLPHEPRMSCAQPHHSHECRSLDCSLAGLLEVLSPVSGTGWNKNRSLTQQHPTQPFHSARKVQRRPLQSQNTSWVPLPPQTCTIQDSEEKEILEEIFFIC